jgi:hypothetical protein
MGRRLRGRLPATPGLLALEGVNTSSLKCKDQQGKAGKALYYNRHHGTKSLSQLVPGEQLLVWNLEARTWRIPAKLVKMLTSRSYIVQLEDGRKLLRNRHQLQVRPAGVTEILLENDDDDVFDTDRMDNVEQQTVNHKNAPGEDIYGESRKGKRRN